MANQGVLSIRGFHAEVGHCAVVRAVRYDQGLAADRAVFDIRLLGNRQIEVERDGFPAVRTRGFLALNEDHGSSPLKISITFNSLVRISALATVYPHTLCPRKSGPAPPAASPGRRRWSGRQAMFRCLYHAYTQVLTAILRPGLFRGRITREHGADRYFKT